MTNQTTTTNTRETTRNRLNELAEKRNELLFILDNFADITRETLTAELNATIHELCDTIAQIATYKTLLKLSDGAKDISQSGADMCADMLRSFPFDLRLYKNNDITDIYSDSMDIYQTAYFEIWQVFRLTAPLTLNDTVYTRALKNGTGKNYTIFQLACKSIREYIHAWSKSQDFKKLHYVIGFTDNGEQVTTSTRPQDNLTDITEQDRKKLFNKYGLTAQQQDIIALVIRGEKADTISILLNIPLRTVQDNIKKAKAKFVVASAYAEYITAKNAEKIARAKAEKNTADRLYLSIYEKAQERTARALQEWKTAFYNEKRKNR